MDRMGKWNEPPICFELRKPTRRSRTRKSQDSALESAADSVGKTVRTAMIQTGGSKPEGLPLSEDIKQVKKKIKGASKALGKPPKKSSDS